MWQSRGHEGLAEARKYAQQQSVSQHGEKKDGKKKQNTSRNSMPLSTEYTEAAVRREEDGCESYGHGDVASPGTCQVFVDVFVHECVLQKSEN